MKIDRLIFVAASYLQGDLGVNDCPEGYYAISDTRICEKASQSLGLDYLEANNDISTGNPVCNFCEDCSPPNTRVDWDHGNQTRLVCESTGK